jgi:RNA-binding protein 25
LRARRVQAEEAADRDSRAYEAREAENLRRESEAFLARQMEDMQALHDEQRRAGMLLDDGAPVRLAVQLATHAAPAPKETKVVLGAEEDEEDAARKRKAPLVKLEFSAPADAEAERAQLEKVKAMVPRERDALFKGKVRWDALTDVRACRVRACVRADARRP